MKNHLLLLALFCSSNLLTGQCLEASYPFNGNTLDQSANGRNLVNNGATLTVDRSGNSNQAYYFDGANDVMLSNHSFDYQDRTIAFWFLPERQFVTNSIYSQDANTLSYGSIGAVINGGVLTLSAGGSDNYTTTNFTMGRWLHVAMTRSAVDVKYYVDGQLVYTGLPSAVGSISYANINLVIGSDRRANRRFFKGSIDEFLVYSCQLSGIQVDSIFQAQKPLPAAPACLEAQYQFNGSPLDYSGRRRSAFNNGATLTFDRSGIPQRAYSFDGNNDLMLTNHSFDYQNRTVAFWVKPQRLSGLNTIMMQDANTLMYGSFGVTLNNGVLELSSAGSDKHTVPSVQASKWIHIGMTRSATETKYYIDGQLVHTGTPDSIGSISFANENLVLGAGRRMNRRFFRGELDDILIYSCEYSGTQIDSIYQAQKPLVITPIACLEAQYLFNGSTFDNSGNGRSPINNGATLTTDRFGDTNAAYLFNGTNNVMLTNHSFDYQERTVAFWAEPQRLIGINYVISQDANTLNYGSFGAFFDNGALNISSGGSDNHIVSTIQNGKWIHVAMTRSATGTKYYIDGRLVHTGVPNAVGSASYANPNLVFGSDRRMNRRFFKGKLDDIVIYSCELSPQQIDSLYLAENFVSNKDQVISSNFSIYPNPVTNTLSVEINSSAEKSFKVFDLNGKVVLAGALLNKKVNVEALPAGIYFIWLEEWANTRQKFIKL